MLPSLVGPTPCRPGPSSSDAHTPLIGSTRAGRTVWGMRTRSVFLVGAVALTTMTVAACVTKTPPPPPPSTTTTTAAPPGCAQPGLPTTVAYRTVPPFPVDLTSVDVHAPATACDAPVVVWVHGGGYHTGDKAQGMDAKVRWANAHGWVLVSVNYRLTHVLNPTGPTSAQFPEHYEDTAAAIGWVHDNIDRYGGDPDRIAVLGHSAGADIVSNVVVNPTYLAGVGMVPSDLVCFGPLDTEGFDKPAAGADDPDGESLQWSSSLGNNPNYLTETSATLLVRPDTGIPPMIGVFRGSAQRQAIEQQLLATVSAAGVPTTTIDARSISHGEVASLIGTPRDTVMTPPLTSLLQGCFAG